jgi:transcriptional regulator with XRE-family HTH domain
MDTTFRDWLKAKLKRRGLKQTVFADLMGVAQATVSRWATGGDLKASHVHRMAEVLGVTIEEVVAAAAGEPAPPPGRMLERVTRYDVHGVAAAYPPRGADLDDHASGRRYILFVEGECLTPEIESGDAVLMDREGRPAVGKVVEIRVGSERHVKTLVHQNGDWVFTSKLGTLTLPPDEFVVEGVMVEVLTPKLPR